VLQPRRKIPSLVVTLLASLLVAGCGNDATTCVTFACATAGRGYRLCSSESRLDYSYGGQSCSCNNDANTAACQACYTSIVNYCGTVDADAGTSPSCVATFSGGIMGTFTPCGITVTQTTPTTWTIAGSGGPVPTTADVWNGFSMSNAGTVAVGTYDESDSTLTIAGASAPSSGSLAGWNATFGQGSATGAFSVELVSLGDSVTNSDGTTGYPGAHGKITATLVDPQGGAINVAVSIQF
jgi:hypothetical protein